jgi:hypothetical protein
MPKSKPPSIKRGTAETAPQDRIIDWIKAGRIDRVAEYIQRGRVHAELDTAALREQWVESFKTWIANPNDSALQESHRDFELELRVRGVDPPIDAIREHFDAVKRYMDECYQSLKQNPEAMRALEQALTEELREFADKLDKAH